jgi:septal ring factor EnvC (AmiA/AmiB activator)
MDPSALRIEFEKQLKDSETKIAQAEEQLAKLKEYRLKLQGGMETLDLLLPKSEEQVVTSDGPPDPTTPATEE